MTLKCGLALRYDRPGMVALTWYIDLALSHTRLLRHLIKIQG